MFFPLPPQQEGGSFSFPATTQPLKECYNSASEKPLHCELPVSSNELCLQLPLWTPPFPYKSTRPSFVLRTWAWFTFRLHVPDCNSLLFSDKPILLEKWLPICISSTCLIIGWFGYHISSKQLLLSQYLLLSSFEYHFILLALV